MAYSVEITARAENDLAGIYEETDAERSRAALKWFRGLIKSFASLEESPSRCPITPENAGLRHLLYGHKPHVYRIIFRVSERPPLVEILHIRHGARRAMKQSDF
jgi:plasmid stabilization system protein ParE